MSNVIQLKDVNCKCMCHKLNEPWYHWKPCCIRPVMNNEVIERGYKESTGRELNIEERDREKKIAAIFSVGHEIDRATRLLKDAIKTFEDVIEVIVDDEYVRLEFKNRNASVKAYLDTKK